MIHQFIVDGRNFGVTSGEIAMAGKDLPEAIRATFQVWGKLYLAWRMRMVAGARIRP